MLVVLRKDALASEVIGEVNGNTEGELKGVLNSNRSDMCAMTEIVNTVAPNAVQDQHGGEEDQTSVVQYSSQCLFAS